MSTIIVVRPRIETETRHYRDQTGRRIAVTVEASAEAGTEGAFRDVPSVWAPDASRSDVSDAWARFRLILVLLVAGGMIVFCLAFFLSAMGVFRYFGVLQPSGGGDPFMEAALVFLRFYSKLALAAAAAAAGWAVYATVLKRKAGR